MTHYEDQIALGDSSVTISKDVAEKAFALLKKQSDADLLIEMLGLDGADGTEPKCSKHGVKKTYTISGYYCKACKSAQDKAARERKKTKNQEKKD